jgi:N-methylhydantoinase A
VSHWSIGIDIGGTFTDFVAIESKMSRIYELKILTTHSDPMIGVIKALKN